MQCSTVSEEEKGEKRGTQIASEVAVHVQAPDSNHEEASNRCGMIDYVFDLRH